MFCLIMGMLPGIPRMVAFEEPGSQPSETQKHNPPGTPRAKQKKTELEKDVGKVGSFVRSACFV